MPSRFFLLALLITCTFFYKNLGHARLIEVQSLHEISTDLLYDPTDYWLITDLDDVLLEGNEALTHSLWLQRTIDGFKKLGISEQEAYEVTYPCWVEFQEKGSVKLIEKDFPCLLSKLTEAGRTLFVYTERPQNIEELTHKQLSSLNINLKHPSISFVYDLPESMKFSSGILFSGELHKGPALQHFFSCTRDLPKKVIYIDNDEKNVLRIEELCLSKKISFLGIVYRAQKLFPPVYQPELAKIQYTFAQKILKNEAAALLLRHGFTE